MKNKIFLAIALFVVVSLFNSCTTPPIEAAQDAYNYNAIIPKVLDGIQGTQVAFQTTSATYTIDYYRGGSTWNWSVDGATIKSVSDDTRTATIEYPTAGTAKITVTETTQGGVTSDPATLDVTVNAFCPKTADWYVGTWVGTESIGGGDNEPITVTISKVDDTTISIDAQDGHPGLLQSVYGGWGEAFQTGFGLDGDIHLTLGLGDGSISMVSGEYWGQTLPGPYDYWYVGSGNWDGCASTISLHFEMHWDEDDFGDGGNRVSDAVLVKQ
ncbi:MAG: hypothetical protein L3J11_12225 [Draconibacterium sp.]|nr:hypothetical protein [Draconibacterium sp.]